MQAYETRSFGRDMRKSLYECRVMEMDGWSDWNPTTRGLMERLHRRRFKNWKRVFQSWMNAMRDGNVIETEVDNTLRQFRFRGLETYGDINCE